MKFLSKLSSDTIVYKELTVKDYREILKCSLGENPDHALFVENLCSVLSNLTDRPPSYFENLNIIDLFCLLVDIRSNSLGSCKVVLTEGEKKINLELNLDLLKEDMSLLFPLISQNILHNHINVTFECPSLKRLIQGDNANEYISFIKECKIFDQNVLSISSNKQALMLFEQLSPQLSLQIIEYYNSFVSKLLQINFLSPYNITKQQITFLPNMEFLLWFIKIIFNENLHSFYENMFYLSYTGKMNIEYIETLAVGEYNFFLGLLRQLTADTKKQEDHGDLSQDPF